VKGDPDRALVAAGVEKVSFCETPSDSMVSKARLCMAIQVLGRSQLGYQGGDDF
jgi:hypothetical protein